MVVQTAWYDALPDDLAPVSPVWASPAFRADVERWCTAQVGPVSALEPVKVRPWSAVWRVRAATGVFYFKENCPGQAFEAALLARLAVLAPDHVVPVTAVDLDRGFLLTPDQGPVFADTCAEDPVDAFVRVAVAGAELQRALVPHVDDLLAADVQGLTPADAAPYTSARIEQLAALPEHDPRRLAADEADALRAHLPVVRRSAEQVAALGLPLTLNHNDLHEHNVFDTAAGMRFFDFGDALVTEPLGVLRILLNVLGGRLDADDGDPRLLRVADAALEVWSDLAPMRELRAALPAALHLARLARAESWLRCLASMTGEERAEYGEAPRRWLSLMLED